jgi:hypothetical protein
MIKWNEVTWYSRLGALILFLAIVPALCFYIGTQYELTVSYSVIPAHPQVITIPISSNKSAQGVSLAGIINTEKINSPNTNYIAVTRSDEQGDTEIFITDSIGKRLTPIFCGSYVSWAKDNSKITAFSPSECATAGYTEAYYYIHTDGTVEPVASSTFIPPIQ